MGPDVDLEDITDSIDQWAKDNNVLLLDVFLTSGYPHALNASVSYQQRAKRKVRP